MKVFEEYKLRTYLTLTTLFAMIYLKTEFLKLEANFTYINTSKKVPYDWWSEKRKRHSNRRSKTRNACVLVGE